RMKLVELKLCHENGVNSITEIMFGYDGIVLAQNSANPALNLTLKQLALALAAKVPKNGKLVTNPYDSWNQIDPSLPQRKIQIYGPPASSGTQDALKTLVLARATKNMPVYDGSYTIIRRDGKYIPTGENDNLIVQRLAQNKTAFGLLGYSFLVENPAVLQAVSINGVEPTRKTISSGKYPVARSLF